MAVTNAIVEVTVHPRLTDPPKDYVVHHLNFTTSEPAPPNTDWQAFADQLRSIFFATTGPGGTPWTLYGGRNGDVKVYDRVDPKPRPEKAISVYAAGTPESAPLAPRQVALCLSFYAGRNLKNTRGRIYIGPFILASVAEKPDSITQNRVLQLGRNLITVNPATGGPWSLVVYSEKLSSEATVDHLWVNDVWDTQRRRLQKETARLLGP